MEEIVEAVLTVDTPLVKTKRAKRSRKKRGPLLRDSVPVAAQPVVTTPEVQSDPEAVKARSLQRPIGSSYSLPGKAEGKSVLFLIDTGCNTNLLSKHLFDKLPDKIKNTLEPCSSHGEMADGSELPFYGMIKIRGRLRKQRFEEVFVVSQISEDGILGMPFLTAKDCTLLFNRPSLMM